MPPNHAGASGGASNANTPMNGDAGMGGEPAPGSSSSGTGGEPSNHTPTCFGDLAEVAKAWGFSCPEELCDARVLASECDALPGAALATSHTSCFEYDAISFELAPSRRKVCYYGSKEFDGASLLVGAAVWDDHASFCNDGATHIEAGLTKPRYLDACEGSPTVTTLCDLTGPDLPRPPSGPPRACYNRFGHVCDVCCPQTAPDCSEQPDGYPGYQCTPDTREDEAFCSCSCQRGEWQCAC